MVDALSLCQPTTTTNLAMSSKKIAWCLILDKMRPDGESFDVEYEDDDTISGLKKKVKGQQPTLLKDVNPNKLLVWRCKDLGTAFTEEQVKRLFADQKVEALGPKRMLATLQRALSEDDTLLVQVPGMFHILILLNNLADLTQMDTYRRATYGHLRVRYYQRGSLSPHQS